MNIPRFNHQSLAPVTYNATKIDPGQPARATLLLTPTGIDGKAVSGEVIVTRLRLNTGGWIEQTFDEVPRLQGLITIQNGSPGLATVEVSVNSTQYRITLLDHEIAAIEVFESMVDGTKNRIVLRGSGVLGADTVVIIGQKSQEALSLPDKWQDSPARENWVWGNLTNIEEKMTSSCAAALVDQTVRVAFDAELSSREANDTSHYSVDVNGATISIASAFYEAASQTVRLTLPYAALKPGDKVVAYWDGLLTSDRRELHGCTQPMTAQ